MENSKSNVIYTIFWLFCVTVVMVSLLCLIIGNNCLMRFAIDETYRVPDTALAHFSVDTVFGMKWRILIIGAYVAGIFAFIFACMSGKVKLGNFSIVLSFFAALIMGTFGYFYIICFPILAFVPFTCMFTHKQLGYFLLIFELIFAIVTLIFEESGLLTGMGNMQVSLQPYQLNYFGLCMFAALAILWFMFGQDKTILSVVVLIIAGIIEWTVLDCRTATIVIACFIIAVLVVDRIRAGKLAFLKKHIWALFRWLPLIMLGLTVVVGLILQWMTSHLDSYDAPFFQRFIELYRFGRDYGFTAFGFDGKTEEIYYYDNSYIHVLCKNGIIPLICFLLFLILINRKIAHNRDYGLMSVATSVYAFSLMENIFNEPLFLLVAGCLLVKSPATKAVQTQGVTFTKKVKILNIIVDNLTIGQTVNNIEKLVRAKANKYVVMPDVDYLLRLEKNAELCVAHEDAYMALANGQAMMWLAEREGKRIRENISASMLIMEICEMAAKKKMSVFILGDKNGAIEDTVKSLKSQNKNLNIAGDYVLSEKFMSSEEEIRMIIKVVNDNKPNIMVVGLGNNSEIFVNKYAEDLDVPISICVGNAVEALAKGVKSCPKWMKDADFEWFHRAIKEPGRSVVRDIKNICCLPRLIRKYGIEPED